jgi:hypothetical protein
MANARLKNTSVRRAGKTSRYWESETDKVSISASSKSEAVTLSFEISSKGGGVTRLWVDVGHGDFGVLLESMRAAHLPATMKHSAALMAGLAEYEVEVRRRSRNEVLDRAKARASASENKDAADAAHFVSKGIERIVSDIVADEAESSQNG